MLKDLKSMFGGGLVNSVTKPMIDGAVKIMDSKEQTNRLSIVAKIYANMMASTWRPELAKAAGACLVLYVIISAVIALTHLVGIVLSATYVSNLNDLWVTWNSIGWKLFGFCGLFLTTYAHARSKYDKQGKESFSDSLTGMFKTPPTITRKPREKAEQAIETRPNIVAPQTVRADTNKSIDLALLEGEIKKEEGFRDHVYFDSLGHATLGYGHLVTEDDQEYGKPEGAKVTIARINALFTDDLDRAIDIARSRVLNFDELPRVAKHVLVSMAFQLGSNGLSKFKNMIAALELEDFQTAALEAMDSKAAQQTPKRWLRHAQAFQSINGVENNELV